MTDFIKITKEEKYELDGSKEEFINMKIPLDKFKCILCDESLVSKFEKGEQFQIEGEINHDNNLNLNMIYFQHLRGECKK